MSTPQLRTAIVWYITLRSCLRSSNVRTCTLRHVRLLYRHLLRLLLNRIRRLSVSNLCPYSTRLPFLLYGDIDNTWRRRRWHGACPHSPRRSLFLKLRVNMCHLRIIRLLRTISRLLCHHPLLNIRLLRIIKSVNRLAASVLRPLILRRILSDNVQLQITVSKSNHLILILIMILVVLIIGIRISRIRSRLIRVRSIILLRNRRALIIRRRKRTTHNTRITERLVRCQPCINRNAHNIINRNIRRSNSTRKTVTLMNRLLMIQLILTRDILSDSISIILKRILALAHNSSQTWHNVRIKIKTADFRNSDSLLTWTYRNLYRVSPPLGLSYFTRFGHASREEGILIVDVICCLYSTPLLYLWYYNTWSVTTCPDNTLDTVTRDVSQRIRDLPVLSLTP